MTRARDLSRALLIPIVVALAAACSQESPMGTESPEEPGEVELFFDRLSASWVEPETVQELVVVRAPG